MSEIVTDNLVAGSSRLTAAAIVLMQLAVGTALAHNLGEALFGPPSEVLVESPSILAQLVAVAIAGLGLGALFQVPVRMLGWATLACFVSFGGARWGTAVVGPEIGVGLGAFLVTLGGNLYGRVFERPAVALVGPAIVLLVPGSVGYRSFMALVEKQTVVGVEIGVSMLLISLSIVTGMIVANAMLSPRLRPRGAEARGGGVVASGMPASRPR